jgi:hypothetical protein
MHRRECNRAAVLGSLGSGEAVLPADRDQAEGEDAQ